MKLTGRRHNDYRPPLLCHRRSGPRRTRRRHRPRASPNILVIFGDDIGQTNISAYGDGIVGYRTPNIDSIADQGLRFIDYYAENSCTAGRSSFITGQTPKRTGLSKVGIPGATVGLQDRDITIAQALKPLGYATGQFGKNHLGDRDEYLPTAHGFDEFFGNLYHLNAEEEPERPYWPSNDPDWVKANSPRGVLKATADGQIEDTGPLTAKRMETIDDETTAAAIDFMKRQHRRRHAVLHLDEHHPDARFHPRPPGDARPERHARQRVCRRHDRARRRRRRVAQGDRRHGHRREHHRHLHHRQRPEPVLLARRRHHAVSLREGHQLGRRLPRPGDGPLARPHPARPGDDRDDSPAWTGSRRCSPPPATRTSRTSSSPASRSATRPSRSISTATTSCRC